MSEITFEQGDVVVHPRRPQWGSGTVYSAQSILHEGRPAQRLVVHLAIMAASSSTPPLLR